MPGHEPSAFPQPPSPPARYTDAPLPPYRHMPGVTPHPIHHPGGHRYDAPDADPSPALFRLPDEWNHCAEYLYGVDLFNAGYFWEAHESWEGAWRVAGRESRPGHFLQGLIQIAAACLKFHEGNGRGVAKLTERAADHLDPFAGGSYMGLDLDAWRRRAGRFLAGESDEYPFIVLEDPS